MQTTSATGVANLWLFNHLNDCNCLHSDCWPVEHFSRATSLSKQFSSNNYSKSLERFAETFYQKANWILFSRVLPMRIAIFQTKWLSFIANVHWTLFKLAGEVTVWKFRIETRIFSAHSSWMIQVRVTAWLTLPLVAILLGTSKTILCSRKIFTVHRSFWGFETFKGNLFVLPLTSRVSSNKLRTIKHQARLPNALSSSLISLLTNCPTNSLLAVSMNS